MKCHFSMIAFPDTTLFPFSRKKENVVDAIYLRTIIPDTVQTGNERLSRRMWGSGDNDGGVFYMGSIRLRESCSAGFMKAPVALHIFIIVVSSSTLMIPAVGRARRHHQFKRGWE